MAGNIAQNGAAGSINYGAVLLQSARGEPLRQDEFSDEPGGSVDMRIRSGREVDVRYAHDPERHVHNCGPEEARIDTVQKNDFGRLRLMNLGYSQDKILDPLAARVAPASDGPCGR